MTPVEEDQIRIYLQYLDETMYSLFDRTVEDVNRNETLKRVILTQNNYILDALAHEREYLKIRKMASSIDASYKCINCDGESSDSSLETIVDSTNREDAPYSIQYERLKRENELLRKLLHEMEEAQPSSDKKEKV
ncbi:unnamed protein product [Acanthoscelides obtectus]|uniref:Uncharacterized protein n=1 Tax=Acanthoscelides obtectus TaxID=200917 RepID=A0A9P0LQM3_ACAOB|nr:unnamed protein product [Acanthoscelides obtectus]CAK1627158.1 hypothetical protein AOBTE_LOCUS4348 [Acanthoscelides obtectus]